MFRFDQVKFKNILDLPDIEIEGNQITTLVGSSGSGKTTLLKLLNKLLSPTSGKIYYQGDDLSTIDSISHRRQVIMLPQTPLAFPGNIRDNLNLGFRLQKQSPKDDRHLLNLLPQLKLNKALNDPTDKLSGGELQRLALGRVMLLDAPVYLLDEPSSALDDETEDLIIQVICNFVRENKKTLVMVTHSRQVAHNFSDTVIEISGGQSRKQTKITDGGSDNE